MTTGSMWKFVTAGAVLYADSSHAEVVDYVRPGDYILLLGKYDLSRVAVLHCTTGMCYSMNEMWFAGYHTSAVKVC